MRDDILTIITEYTGTKRENINDSDFFFADLMADEMDMVDIFLDIEDTFFISLPNSLIRNSLTVVELLEFVGIQMRDKHK